MQVESPAKIRNVAVAGHNDTGKTTLVSALLYTAGVTNRLNRVEDKNTVTDFDPEEIERGISIGLATCHLPWRQPGRPRGGGGGGARPPDRGGGGDRRPPDGGLLRAGDAVAAGPGERSAPGGPPAPALPARPRGRGARHRQFGGPRRPGLDPP